MENFPQIFNGLQTLTIAHKLPMSHVCGVSGYASLYFLSYLFVEEQIPFAIIHLFSRYLQQLSISSVTSVVICLAIITNKLLNVAAPKRYVYQQNGHCLFLRTLLYCIYACVLNMSWIFFSYHSSIFFSKTVIVDLITVVKPIRVIFSFSYTFQLKYVKPNKVEGKYFNFRNSSPAQKNGMSLIHRFALFLYRSDLSG